MRPATAQSGRSVHPDPPRSVRAAARTTPIVLDGRLDEAAWQAAEPATDFTQSQPDEGQPATQRTEVRFLYDDEAIWIGARMYDELGAAGVRTRLVRRDREADSDLLTIIFDTYHDHLGRTEFTINPSGVKGDGLGPGNASTDPSWDPVWQAATAIDSLGWVAELRIPLSQLRFPRDSLQTWGLQIVRFASRLNERSHWAFWRLNESGGPARYGHLEGLVLAASPRRAEVLPYIVARTSHLQPVDPNDPFHDDNAGDYRIGGDLKVLLTSNLTLDATINPDFGQVEVDPAVVNLTAFETFFEEKRAFFVEGAGVFGFGWISCFFCSNVSSLNLFYSRRIGRPPQGASLAYDAGDYADVPENTTILGAAKVTGRTAGGWTIGIMDAVTRREHAVVAKGPDRFRRVVEPATNYFVGRVKRDLRDGAMTIGGIVTSVYRDLDDAALAERLTRRAEAVGVDLDAWWGERTYQLMVRAAVSQVTGEAAAIRRVQESSARYFQRPDRDGGSNGLFSSAYDPDATALRGYALYARIAKDAGDWLWETSVNLRSPGFEVNDLAFLSRADYIWMNANILRQFTRPSRYYRNLMLIAGGQQRLNFSGDITERQLQAYAGVTLHNYWEVSGFYIHRPSTLKDDWTRGGPLVRGAGSWFAQLEVSSDARKPVVLGTFPYISRNEEGALEYSLGLDVTIRPAPNISISLSPSYSHNGSSAQYVTAVEDPTATQFFGRRYVFSDLVQKSLSMDTRLNVTFTPTLSLELFAQPLIASGRFTNFKEHVAPRQLEKSVYGRDQGTIRAEAAGENREYVVDPDGPGPAQEFRFDDPDFNLRSLRGNALLRWEYRPGSTLYLVWTQSRSDTAPFGDLDFSRDRRALFRTQPDNVFLVKVSYWLGL
ncbi:MAG TPA: DUF5916 domain-containing protein [Longimicrobiales bacterium]